MRIAVIYYIIMPSSWKPMSVNKPIIESVLATSLKYRFDKMWHQLHPENDRLDELSSLNENSKTNNYLLLANEVDLLKRIFDINSNSIDVNWSSVGEEESIQNIRQFDKRFQYDSDEESKFSQ